MSKELVQEEIFARPEIGQMVRATNGTGWFYGKFEKEIELFAPYGVRLDNGELRYFIQIEVSDLVGKDGK